MSNLNLPDGWIVDENGIKYKPAICVDCGKLYYVRSSVRATRWCPVCRVERKRQHGREHYRNSRHEFIDDSAHNCKFCEHRILCQQIVLTATKLPCETNYPLYDARVPAEILSHNNQVAKTIYVRLASSAAQEGDK